MLKETLGQPIHLVGIGLAALSAIAVMVLTLALFHHSMNPRQTAQAVADATTPSYAPTDLPTGPAPGPTSLPAPSKGSTPAVRGPVAAPLAARPFASTQAAARPAATALPSVPSTPRPVAKGVVSPTSLDFGSIALSSASSPAYVVIANNGGASLVIGGVSNPGTDFTIVSDACSGTSIAPGQSCQMTVAFTPQSTGPLNATLFISSNSAVPLAAVSLRGIGV
jgi:hypothetical protein